MKKIFIILFFAPLITNGQLYTLSEDILCSPVLLKTNIGQGSGVFIQDTTYVYFATARHNLFSIDTIKKKGKIDTIFKFLPSSGQFFFYPHDVIKIIRQLLRLT